MNFLSRAHIIKYHKDNIKNFGVDSKEALGWKNKENQLIRFKVLAQIGDLTGHELLDAGCATGDLFEFLLAFKIKCSYTGIDQMPEFIDFAAKKFNRFPDCSFLMGDFWTANLKRFDFVLASGALSYRNPDPNFIYKMIFRLYSFSRVALGFNLLETVELKDGGLVAYDKNRIVEYCRKICPNVVLKDNYIPGDYTVYMYRALPAGPPQD